MTPPLSDKVALVTGASSGIGRAIALALAEQGADVAVGARRADRLASLRDQLTASGVKALTVDLDVTDEGACRAAVDATIGEFGRLDLVVNSAGVMLLGAIVGADTADWRRMINTNVLGLMYVTHAALPHLLERGGDIVQISSVAGRVARKGSGVYNASKWAVNAFSEALRQEVTDRGVRITMIEPGAVDTELRTHITQQDARQRSEQQAAGIRQLRPEDVAHVVDVVTRPAHMSINEVLVRPTDQSW
jgi:clavulanate-9-aldehyde reductase